jgi:predicted phage terminase large subunit-like protein
MEAALAERSEPTPAQPGSLRSIARNLLDRADKCTLAAREVADRLDGRVAARVVGDDDEPPVRVASIERDTLRVYGASDYAVTADGGDYTVHVVVGLDPEGCMYLLDLWRKQVASDEWIEAFCDLVKEWKPIEWAEETGQIKVGVGPFLDRRQRERQAWVYRRQFPTRGDKAVRAQSIRGRMALQGLYVPTNADWLSDFRTELLSFPAGKHDDQVDALGLVGQLLDTTVHSNKLPKAPVAERSQEYVRYHFGRADCGHEETNKGARCNALIRLIGPPTEVLGSSPVMVR